MKDSKMIITAKSVRSLNPCKPGILNFEKYYPEFEGSLSELLSLEKIPYEDKVWLVRRVVKKSILLKKWAVVCAESVLDIYEKAHPQDMRIRDCLETTKIYLMGGCSREVLIEKRNAVAYAAVAYAAAVNANAAYAANAAAAKTEQQNLNLLFLISLLEEESSCEA